MTTIPSILPLPPNRVWRTYLGGATLDRMEGKDVPADTHFPEDWILSTTAAINQGREEYREEGLSRTRIADRELSLRDLFAEQPQEMVGPEHYRRFGAQAAFLLKYLDSSIRLHLQCHPTVPFSQQHLNSNAGKTEGYVILGHRPEVQPYIYLGFQRPPDPVRFRQAIVEQDTAFILSCFDRIPVKAGDVFLVPGGLPHAIGEGVFMIEIMEPTDFAVRIEFERGGYVLPEASRFMGRDVDFALSMFDFTAYDLEQLKARFFVEPRLLEEQGRNRRWSLFDSRYTGCFRVERLEVADRMTVSHDGFRVMIVTSGSGTIRSGDTVISVRQGDRRLIPHQTENVTLESATGMELIVARPPQASNAI